MSTYHHQESQIHGASLELSNKLDALMDMPQFQFWITAKSASGHAPNAQALASINAQSVNHHFIWWMEDANFIVIKDLYQMKVLVNVKVIIFMHSI